MRLGQGVGDLGIYRGERRSRATKAAREGRGRMHRVRNELGESQRKPERTAR